MDLSILLTVIMKIVLLTKANKNNWYYDILNNVYEEVDPFQVSIFTSESVTINDTPSIKEYPTTAMSFNKKAIIRLSFFEKYIHKSLIIFFTSNISESRALTDSVSNLSTFHERPKCLIILLDRNFTNDNDFELIFKDAWSKNILDLTVTRQEKENHSVVYSYNPFYQTIVKKPYKKNVKIFPNKMSDMNQYPILVSNPVSRYKQLVRKEYKLKAYGPDDFLIHYLLESMGFTVIYDEKKVTNPCKNISPDSYFKMRKVRMVGNVINAICASNQLVVQRSQDPPTLIAVVPVLTKQKVNISKSLFLYILAVLLTIIGFRAMKRLRQTIGAFEIVQIILGQEIDNREINIKIYVILFVISIFITNDLYTEIVNMEYVTEEMPFDRIEDLVRSGFTPYYTFPPQLSYALKGYYHNSLMSEGYGQFLGLDDCLNLLKKTKNILCIGFEHDAQIRLSKYKNSDGSASMKIAKISLVTLVSFYLFEDGSPYAKKFANLLRRIQEFGYLHMPFLLNDTKIEQIDNDYNLKDEDTVSSNQLLILSLVGILTAVFVFFIELSMSRMKMRIRNRLNKISFKNILPSHDTFYQEVIKRFFVKRFTKKLFKNR